MGRWGRSPKTKRNHKINSEKSLENKDNNCNKCSSSISDSARMENTKSDKLNKTPAPSLEESIQLETSAQYINSTEAKKHTKQIFFSTKRYKSHANIGRKSGKNNCTKSYFKCRYWDPVSSSKPDQPKLDK